MSGSPPFKVSEPAPDDAARLAEQRERNQSRRARRKERAAAQDPPPGRAMSLNERLDRLEALLTWLVCQHDPELGSELIELIDSSAKTMEAPSMTPEQEQALGLRASWRHGLRFSGVDDSGNLVIDARVTLLGIPPSVWSAGRMAEDEAQRGRRDGGDDDD